MVAPLRLAAGAVGGMVAAPVVLHGVGFTSGGVAAGSITAGVQSSIGNVAAGSAFADLQSAGAAAGLSGCAAVTAGLAGALVVGLAGGMRALDASYNERQRLAIESENRHRDADDEALRIREETEARREF